ncbi:hypothetical protein ACFCYX_33230 [Streptomyces populi]|uniref:hypothetical protein n=1 Tax=Streptomyces populi TaxID=2058924 RepID=UPI0013A6CEA1|nr:hypothetical protein [Streptomyces populi]
MSEHAARTAALGIDAYVAGTLYREDPNTAVMSSGMSTAREAPRFENRYAPATSTAPPTMSPETGCRLRVLPGRRTESALGVTAMARPAPSADPLDLDGHLELLDDPFSGVVIDRGRIVPPDDPGPGARSRPDSENTWEN